MITVITPTYKRYQYLKNAIESVLAQTYTDFEYIIVDDNPVGTKDRTLTKDVIKSFSDSRIRYVQNQENLGGAGSRNVAIAMAKGEYIAFLDDDDIYLPDRLRVQVEAMQKNDWEVCVMDGITYHYETGKFVSIKHQHLKQNMSNDELIRNHLLYHISGTNTFMFKTDFLRKIGGFDVIPSCQEYVLMQKALDAKPKFGYLPIILIKNFQHDGEQISTGSKKLTGQKLLIANKKKYFYLLNNKEKRQVLCRYHGVLFFVYFKMHVFLHAISELILCFFYSPKNAIAWANEYAGKIKS
ncbi:MAG: glycosyltransferase family 2 protein [Bacteroidales bacterium]|nr:glycosyltransferase family 2 protein [Candidatus Colimorpha onthohippi]